MEYRRISAQSRCECNLWRLFNHITSHQLDELISDSERGGGRLKAGDSVLE